MGASDERNPGESRVTRLFDEYRSAKDRSVTPDVDELLARAGNAKDELHDRIRVFDELNALSTDLDNRSELPATLGRFEILHPIGSGGIARVYLARDPNLDRQVALKVLDKNLVPDRREREWVLNEARSLAVLEHEGVVRVFEVGHADGFDYVAVEHLTGPSLAQVVFELRRVKLGTGAFDDSEPSDARRLALELVDFRARARCMLRIATALAYCHNRGVIHRDVKPENVVFDGDGTPKLIDFGLAHLEGREGESQTHITQQLIGSAAYVAPEQVAANQTGADPRSDQFSLCTLFYELLALENPFEAGTAQLTTAAVLECVPPALRRRAVDAPVELATIVEHGLEREPDDRYPSVQALADDLDAFLSLRPLSVAPPSMARRSSLWLRRNRRAVALASLAVFLLLAGIVGMWGRGVAAQRRAILDSLEKVAASPVATPEDFFASALVLSGARDNAIEFDRGFAHGRFGPRLVPTVQASIEPWSRALAQAFNEGSLFATTAAESLRFEDETIDGEFLPGMKSTQDPGWRFAFLLEELLCPDCPYNLEARSRGVVALPDLADAEGLRMELQMARRPSVKPPVHLDYRPLARPYPRRLTQGAYRLLVTREGADTIVHDVRFDVSRPWPPPRTIELRERAPSLEDDADVVDVPSGTVSVYGELVPIPAFRVTRDLVTRRDFERFQESPDYQVYLQQRGPEPLEVDETRELDEPVWTDLDAAMAYCSWMGGRLPSIEELLFAQDEGFLLAEREWVCNVCWLQNTWNGTYLDNKSAPSTPDGWGFALNPLRRKLALRNGRAPAFRVAVSTDHPDRYFETK